MWRSAALLIEKMVLPSFMNIVNQADDFTIYIYKVVYHACLRIVFFNEKNKQRGQMIILASQTDIYFKVFDSMKITC